MSSAALDDRRREQKEKKDKEKMGQKDSGGRRKLGTRMEKTPTKRWYQNGSPYELVRPSASQRGIRFPNGHEGTCFCTGPKHNKSIWIPTAAETIFVEGGKHSHNLNNIMSKASRFSKCFRKIYSHFPNFPQKYKSGLKLPINKYILAYTSRKSKAPSKSPPWNTKSAYTYLHVRMN